MVKNTFSIHTAVTKVFHPKEAFIGKLQHANSYVKGIYLAYLFLGACTKYHKSDYSLCHVSLSIIPHEASRLPLDGFFMKFDI